MTKHEKGMTSQPMKRGDILKLIKGLACSQGLYGRLYGWLMSLTPEDRDEVLTDCEARRFNSGYEFVMFIEA